VRTSERASQPGVGAVLVHSRTRRCDRRTGRAIVKTDGGKGTERERKRAV